jgi:putative transposase
LEELKRRGLKDIFILCADGLKGLPQAVETAFPQTIFQTCIVHMIRSSTRFVPWKERKAVCASLREIYTAVDEAAALAALEAFEAQWGERFPMIGRAWSERWDELTPFLEYPAEIRRVVYTTNAVEALNRQLRKVLKTKGHFPDDDSALKLLHLACLNAEKSWKGKAHTWTTALGQFAVYFEGRLPKAA